MDDLKLYGRNDRENRATRTVVTHGENLQPRHLSAIGDREMCHKLQLGKVADTKIITIPNARYKYLGVLMMK